MFPGSFDPFTAGHLNILKRALTMFDEVVVAVGVNSDKRGFFSNEKKLEIIRQATAGLEGVSLRLASAIDLSVSKSIILRTPRTI